jgi:hypothetical protein
MAQWGFLWRHFTINTHGTWLHGDPRGFRSREHRIHSSGDYKNPPPPGEHFLLYEHERRVCRDEVTTPHDLKCVVGRALIEYFLGEKFRILCLAVAKVHTHGVVELPCDLRKVRQIIGQAKHHASRRVINRIPGSLWSDGGKFVPVLDDGHLRAAYEYDLYEQGPSAWTWAFRDGSRNGMFGRVRPQPEESGAAHSLPRRG